MSVRHIAAIGLCLLGTAAALSAQDRGAGLPSTFTRRPGEVWSEVGLRAVNDALLVEATGQRSRVRLLTRDQKEVIIEGSTFIPPAIGLDRDDKVTRADECELDAVDSALDVALFDRCLAYARPGPEEAEGRHEQEETRQC